MWWTVGLNVITISTFQSSEYFIYVAVDEIKIKIIRGSGMNGIETSLHWTQKWNY